MPPLTNKKFITELGRMSNSVNYTGAISITFKRYNADVNCFPSKKKAEPDMKKNRCLVRAVSPRKKITTIVAAKDVPSFSRAINGVLRGSITYLKKGQRKGRKASQ